MKDFAASFYKSRIWNHTREAYLESVGGMCERCMARGLVTPAEIVHHIEHLTPQNIVDPEVTLGFGNLEAVCRKCHGEEHGKPRVYEFDEDGRLL